MTDLFKTGPSPVKKPRSEEIDIDDDAPAEDASAGVVVPETEVQ